MHRLMMVFTTLHGLSRRNFPPRLVGFWLLVLLLVTILRSPEQFHFSASRYAVLPAWCVVVALWPPVAWLMAWRGKSSRTVEYRLVNVDSFIGGVAIGLLGCSLMPSQAILFSLCANNIMIGGVKLFLRGSAYLLAGWILTMLLAGWQFHPESSVATASLAVAFVFCYISFTSYVAYTQAKSLVKAKSNIEQQHQELLRQQEILSEQAREIELANAQLQEKHLELGAAYEEADALNTSLAETLRALEAERTTAEHLLLNILPVSIAERMKRGETRIAERFDQVTVLFADIVGFTTLSSTMEPNALLNLLDAVFSDFDSIVEKYRLEKIKTIGDAYMLAAGLPDTAEDHTKAMAEAALEMLALSELLCLADGTRLQFRIGIHLGNVVAGVIGTKKFAYDLWGDTVNTASRMESHSEAGKIHVSEEVYEALKEKFVFEERGEIDIKGKGTMRTWFLKGFKHISPQGA